MFTDRKTVYIVFGKHTEEVARHLSRDFDVSGHERTLEAAVDSIEKLAKKPDVFLIAGTALVTGLSESSINHGKVLLENLKKIRVACPESRVKVVLSEKAGDEIVKGIVSLGIYDVFRIGNLTLSGLPEIINTQKTIADHLGNIQDIEPPPQELRKEEIAVGEEKDDDSANIAERLKNLARTVIGDREVDDPAKQKPPEKPAKPLRKRSGRPAAVLGVGDTRIEDWIRDNFSDQMDVLLAASDPEEIKNKIEELYPDIFVVMRQSAIGGIPGADELAVWAAARVPAVLFIIGELDEPGKVMFERASKAGVRHIISCEKGGFISGDELVYVLTSVIREIQAVQPGEEKEVAFEARKTINSLFRGTGVLGRLKQTVEVEKPKAKTPKPKIKMRDGLSLEDGAPSEAVVVLKNPTSIVPGGILAVVTPWRPNLAGRLAAQAVRILSEVEGGEVVYVGASKNSTGALWLNVSDEELMMSDWRVPGSSFPITQENIKIYAVDPAKDLPAEGEIDLWSIVKQARKTATYTVVDFAGDMAAAGKAAHQGRAVVLVILPGNDPVEYKIASLWFRNLMEGKQNVVAGIDLRGSPNGIPEGLRPKVVIRNNPADALASVLKKNNDDEFIWN